MTVMIGNLTDGLAIMLGIAVIATIIGIIWLGIFIGTVLGSGKSRKVITNQLDLSDDDEDEDEE